jgi:hypothetical protein
MIAAPLEQVGGAQGVVVDEVVVLAERERQHLVEQFLLARKGSKRQGVGGGMLAGVGGAAGGGVSAAGSRAVMLG